VFSYWFAGRREDKNRRRQSYAEAFAACTAYREFPYVVRRRRHDKPEDERARISGQLADTLRTLQYFKAWIRTDSTRVAQTFEAMVEATRAKVGPQISAAWNAPAAQRDTDMNLGSRIDLDGLAELDEEYLVAVREHLSGIPSAARMLGRLPPSMWRRVRRQ
jgi:hypothetical protein